MNEARSPELDVMMTTTILYDKPDWATRAELFTAITDRLFNSVPDLKAHQDRAKMVDDIGRRAYQLMTQVDQKRINELTEELKKKPGAEARLLGLPDFP